MESILNVLTLDQAEVPGWASFAVLGKQWGTPLVARLQRLPRLRDLVVAFDPDARREALHLARSLSDSLRGVSVKVARFPTGQDVNSLGGRRAWLNVHAAEAYQPERHLRMLHA